MTDIATLVEVLVHGALLVGPPVLLGRFVAREGASVSDLLPIVHDAPWPRGVQEEEPVRWQVERLRPRRRLVGQAPDELPAATRTRTAGAGLTACEGV